MRHRRRQRRLDLLNAIPRKKKRLEAGEEGEIPEGGNGVIREIDSILILLRKEHEHELGHEQKQDKKGTTNLRDTQVFNRGNLMSYTTRTHKTLSIQLISKV